MHSTRSRRLVIALGAVAVLAGCGASSTPTPTMSPPPTPSGKGADLQALIADGPAGYDRLPDSTTQGVGYETLDNAVGSDPAARARLVQDNFQYGYTAVWARSRIRIEAQVAVVKYGSAAGATDVQSYVVSDTRAQAAKAGDTVVDLSLDTGIPGAVCLAVTHATKNQTEYLIYFPLRNYHVDIGVVAPTSPATAEDDPTLMKATLLDLAKREFAKLG